MSLYPQLFPDRNMKKINGFTLVEVMIAVVVVAILLTGGSLVLFGTLGSRGQNQADININQAGSQAMESIEQSIRFANIEAVGASDREDCRAAGSIGVSGSNVTVRDSWGSSTYSLDSDRLASSSGSTVYLSTPNVVASSLSFTWLCVNGSYDKLRVTFDLNDVSVASELLKRTFKRDINMYNSGI